MLLNHLVLGPNLISYCPPVPQLQTHPQQSQDRKLFTRSGMKVVHTCNKTFTRSAGPATKVAGTALNPPAIANSPIDNACLSLLGVAAYTSRLPTSYPQKEMAKIGVTPTRGGVIPLYILLSQLYPCDYVYNIIMIWLLHLLIDSPLSIFTAEAKSWWR
jgi:hypothetical protein